MEARPRILAGAMPGSFGELGEPNQENAMTVDINVETLSVAEKVQLLERNWQNFCTHPCDVRSPEWHLEVLDERRRRLEDGLATLSTWADAKTRLMQLGR